MGAREGTKPEHNPLTRSLSARAQAHGDREGYARGLREGRTEPMVMVMLCVIADHEEGWDLTRRISEQLDLHTDVQQ